MSRPRTGSVRGPQETISDDVSLRIVPHLSDNATDSGRCGRPRRDGRPCRNRPYWADGSCRRHVNDPEVAVSPDRDVRSQVDGGRVTLWLVGLACDARRAVAFTPDKARLVAEVLWAQADEVEAGERDE